MNSYEKYFDDVLFRKYKKQSGKNVSDSIIWKQINAFKINNPKEYQKQLDEFFANF